MQLVVRILVVRYKAPGPAYRTVDLRRSSNDGRAADAYARHANLVFVLGLRYVRPATAWSSQWRPRRGNAAGIEDTAVLYHHAASQHERTAHERRGQGSDLMQNKQTKTNETINMMVMATMRRGDVCKDEC